MRRIEVLGNWTVLFDRHRAHTPDSQLTAINYVNRSLMDSQEIIAPHKFLFDLSGRRSQFDFDSGFLAQVGRGMYMCAYVPPVVLPVDYLEFDDILLARNSFPIRPSFPSGKVPTLCCRSNSRVTRVSKLDPLACVRPAFVKSRANAYTRMTTMQ